MQTDLTAQWCALIAFTHLCLVHATARLRGRCSKQCRRRVGRLLLCMVRPCVCLSALVAEIYALFPFVIVLRHPCRMGFLYLARWLRRSPFPPGAVCRCSCCSLFNVAMPCSCPFLACLFAGNGWSLAAVTFSAIACGNSWFGKNCKAAL